MLDEYRHIILGWFKEHPTLKAQQVHGWLRTRGLKISYPAVVKYTRAFHKKVPRAYHQLTFLPGEDYGKKEIMLSLSEIDRTGLL